MPLEIRELNIKVNVGGQAGGGEGGTTAPPIRSGQEQAEDKDQLASQIVDQVIQVMKQRKER